MRFRYGSGWKMKRRMYIPAPKPYRQADRWKYPGFPSSGYSGRMLGRSSPSANNRRYKSTPPFPNPVSSRRASTRSLPFPPVSLPGQREPYRSTRTRVEVGPDIYNIYRYEKPWCISGCITVFCWQENVIKR